MCPEGVVPELPASQAGVMKGAGRTVVAGARVEPVADLATVVREVPRNPLFFFLSVREPRRPRDLFFFRSRSRPPLLPLRLRTISLSGRLGFAGVEVAAEPLDFLSEPLVGSTSADGLMLCRRTVAFSRRHERECQVQLVQVGTLNCIDHRFTKEFISLVDPSMAL